MEDAVVDDGADDADPLWHMIVNPSANPHRNVGILMLFRFGNATKAFSPINRRVDDVDVPLLYCFYLS